MAALGYIMMGGMIFGAMANSVIDTMNVDKNCENANKMIESMEKMHQFYRSISDANLENQNKCKEMLDKLKLEHSQHQTIIDDYFKNNNDRQRRTEIVLLTSLCLILLNFIIKSNIVPMSYNYLFPKK
tara:strand:+ start:148 stop:531 length:384 start_codon:yes stop_codon:yes gene_type:complete